MNKIEYAQLFQQTLDKQMLQAMTSAWMEANDKLVKYNGGNEIKIADVLMDGLADYDRGKGYVSGAINLKYKTYGLTQDRGREFLLDAMDVDESGFVISASTVMAEFQRTQVAPEVDSYRYSKLATTAIDAGNVTQYSAKKADVLQKLDEDIYKILDSTGLNEENLMITMSIPVRSILNNSSEITKKLDVGEFKRNEVTTKVNYYNGTPIIGVSSSRMKTKYIIKDGTTAGQEQGGASPDTTAKNINWIISTLDAPIGIVKTDVVRIFTPQETQKANAWKMDYRKYHDVFVTANKVKGIWVNVE